MAGLASSLVYFYLGLGSSDELKPPAPASSAVNQAVATINYSVPTRLSIPKLSVDTEITSVGTTASGNMDTPANDEDVGWYKEGPYPGNEGSSVIAGHVGIGGSAVFMNLDELQAGDTMTTVDSNGQVATFIVRETKIYGKDEQPPEVFTSASGSHLNLITCTGAWEEDQQTFTHRLVVFADAAN